MAIKAPKDGTSSVGLHFMNFAGFLWIHESASTVSSNIEPNYNLNATVC